MAFIDLKILNPPEELEAFPLNQKIVLTSSKNLESSLIENNLVLIRQADDQGVLRTSDIYNSNIGHVKNIYATVPVTVTQELQSDLTYKIICDPVQPLLPGSKYLLFLDKNLSSEFISISKTVSKGPSQLELLTVAEDSTTEVEYVLKVVSEPALTQTANIVKFQLHIDGVPNKVFTVNARSTKNTIQFSGVSILVLDTAYALGEEFQIIHTGDRIQLQENYIVPITTSISTSVKALEGIEPSSSISYEDVLNYYKEADASTLKGQIGLDTSVVGWEKNEFSIQYIDDDSFILHLNKLTTDLLDLNAMAWRQLPAYNRSDLKCLDKYDPKKKYLLIPDILDEKSVLFTIEPEGLVKSTWARDIVDPNIRGVHLTEEWVP